MFRTLETPFRMPLWLHTIAAAITIAGFQLSKSVLDKSYAASQHPVDFMTGQTGFSGPAIKGYYAHMLEQGTLDIYWRTQLIDFGFILAMFSMGFLVCTFIARLGPPQSWGRRVGLLAALCVMFGAASDAIENLWSFIMLSNPSGFADWLAYPYSGFAVLKFALITIGLGLVVVSILLSLSARLSTAFASRKP